MALVVFAHTAFNGSRVAASLFALGQEASPLEVGVILSMYSILPMLLAVPAGRMIDRIGPALPLLWSSVAIAAGVALPALWRDVSSLYVACTVAGVGFMTFQLAVQNAVAALSGPESRAVNFSWLALGFSVSGFLGPTLTGLGIDFIGFAMTFGLLAVAGAVPAIALAALRPRVPRSRSSAPPGGRMADLFGNRELREVFIVTTLLAMAWDVFVFVMPIYGNSIGLSASQIGAVLGAFGLATFLVRLLLPWAAKRFAEWNLVTLTLAVACAAYVLFPAVSTVPLLSAIAFLLGLGLGAAQPSIMSLIQRSAPPGRMGEALGVRTMLLSASHSVLPLLFGGFGTAMGVAPLFLLMAGCLGAGGLFARHCRGRGA